MTTSHHIHTIKYMIYLLTVMKQKISPKYTSILRDRRRGKIFLTALQFQTIQIRLITAQLSLTP
jgi:hypothetical protein